MNKYLKIQALDNIMPINNYKGINYFLDKDNLWKVIINKEIFIVALDDSKEELNRKINWKFNKEQTCKKYIDWILN